MKLLNSFWFVDVGRLLYNGPTISHFFINSRIKRWIDWKKWKRLMGGPLSLRMEWINGMKWDWVAGCAAIKQINWMPMELMSGMAPQAAPQRGKSINSIQLNEGSSGSPSFNGWVEWKRLSFSLMEEEVVALRAARPLREPKRRPAHASQTTSFLSGPNPKRNESGMAAKRELN